MANDDTNQTGSALRGLATATYDWVQHPFGNAGGEAPATPAPPKPPEGTIPPVAVPTQDTVKAKYKLPPSADLSKPFFDPANKDVKDATAFSQASQEFNPPPATKSLARRALDKAGELTGITAPAEGTASPVTGTDVAGDVAGLLAGGAANAAIEEYGAPLVRAVATKVANWRVAKDAEAAVAKEAADAGARIINLKPSEYNFSDIGGTEVAPPPAPAAATEEVKPPVNLEPAGAITHEVGAHPNPEVAASANRYNATRGGAVINHEPAVLASPAARAALADKFEELQHNPNDPAVKKAYDALKTETLAQFNHAQNDLGVQFEFTPDNPYENAEQMTRDVRNNKHLAVYNGGNELPEGHPLAEIEPTTGQSYNNLFRATHAIYGHAAGGNEFTEPGEEAAYGAHVQMYSPEAQPAVQNETQGQSNWYFNNKAVREGKPMGDFAQQKAAVLPAEEHPAVSARVRQIQNVGTESLPPEIQKEAELTTGDNPVQWTYKNLPISQFDDMNEDAAYADDEHIDNLTDDIKQNGIKSPIIWGPEGIEGQHRIEAAKRAGLKTIPTLVGEVPEEEEEITPSKGSNFSGALSQGSKAANTPEWVAGEYGHHIDMLEKVLRNPDSTAEEKEIAGSMLQHTRELAESGLSPVVQKSVPLLRDDAMQAGLEYKGSMEGKGGEVYHTFDDPARPGDQINVKQSEIPTENIPQFLRDKMTAKRSEAGSTGETVEQMRQRLLSSVAQKSAPATQPLQPREPEQEGIAGTVRGDIHHEMGHILVARHHGIGNLDGILTGRHPDAGSGSVAAMIFDFSPWGIKPGANLPSGTVVRHLDQILDMYIGGGAGEESTEGLPMARNPGMNQDIRVIRTILAHLNYTKPEIDAKIAAAQQRAKQILIDSGAPNIMKQFSAAREEGLPDTHHMSQERVEELVQEVQNAKQKASEGRGNLGRTGQEAVGNRQPNDTGGKGGGAQGQPGAQAVKRPNLSALSKPGKSTQR